MMLVCFKCNCQEDEGDEMEENFGKDDGNGAKKVCVCEVCCGGLHTTHDGDLS